MDLDRLADPDYPRGSVHVLPAEPKQLARAQAAHDPGVQVGPPPRRQLHTNSCSTWATVMDRDSRRVPRGQGTSSATLRATRPSRCARRIARTSTERVAVMVYVA